MLHYSKIPLKDLFGLGSLCYYFAKIILMQDNDNERLDNF